MRRRTSAVSVRTTALMKTVSLVEMADEDVGVEGDHRRRP